jgi:acyl-CoA hydrolase
MPLPVSDGKCLEMQSIYPQKFATEEEIFRHIHRGDRIFISTACGEPQYLVRALIQFVESNPKAFFDAEVLHVWTLGVAPYTDEKLNSTFATILFLSAAIPARRSIAGSRITPPSSFPTSRISSPGASFP